jgi:hypothetical protein
VGFPFSAKLNVTVICLDGDSTDWACAKSRNDSNTIENIFFMLLIFFKDKNFGLSKKNSS